MTRQRKTTHKTDTILLLTVDLELNPYPYFLHLNLNFSISLPPKMRGATVLLALIPVAAADWTLTWYSDAKCTKPLGHIEHDDGVALGGNFDDNVASLITNYDASRGTIELTSDELGITEAGNPGACMDWSVGVSKWAYAVEI